ncbi:NDP-sugar synthase [Patescibacteria group bacterium]|nr:NDP-sugar synthase [Patescibacteria group bacterium]
MKAVIIAGGLGTRLRPLTYNVPKPIVPVANIALVLHQIEWLKKYGINDIILNLHYLSDEIKKLVKNEEKELGCKIYFSIEEDPLGTAGAVKNAEQFFDKDPLVVLNGDVITGLNLARLIDFHKKNKAKATLALKKVQDPTPFGLVLTDPKGRVKEFIEKPAWVRLEGIREFFINAGTYVLDPSVFKDVPAGKPYMFENGLFPLLLERGDPMFGFKDTSYWIDIGNPSKYLEVHEAILRGEVALNIKGKRIKDDIWVGEGAEIDRSAQLYSPCLLGRQIFVGERAAIKEISVLGDRVKVGENSVIERAVIWTGTQVGKDVIIKNSVIGRNCHIEDEVRIDGAVIGDKTVITKGSYFNA